MGLTPIPLSNNMLSNTFALRTFCCWPSPSNGANILKACKLSALCSLVEPILAIPIILLFSLPIALFNFANSSGLDVTNFSIKLTPACLFC